jgi:hypothetical protein
MLHRTRFALAALVAAALCTTAARADLTESLKKGTPDLKSIGALAFAADGVLFVGDPMGGAIFAIDTGDKTAGTPSAFKVEGLDGKIASLLGIDAKQLLINDLAVNPASGNAYLSVTRGQGGEAMPVLLRVDRKGKVEEVPLKDIKFAKATLPDPPASKDRLQSITGLAFVNGRVFVAGLANEEFSSTLRGIPFPFTEADKGTGVEIYHGSHGKFETASPVRTFAAYEIKGEPHLLAAYTCTPLVKIPVKELKPGEKVKGTTVAELGNGNRPLDMIVYQKGGKDYILMSNNKRGVMKITTEGIDKIEPITSQVKSSATAGLTYETLTDLKGVEQMAKLDDTHALLLVRTSSGAYNLETIELP